MYKVMYVYELEFDNDDYSDEYVDIIGLAKDTALRDLKSQLNDGSITSDKFTVYEVPKIKVFVSAYCPSREDFNLLRHNFIEYYWHFSHHFEEESLSYDERTHIARVMWVGDASDTFNKDEFIRLTHHAEGIYENTNIEHTHVEVCIDNEWYGK